MFAGLGGNFPAALCSVEEADLQKVWLNNIFKCVPLFAQCSRNGINTGWAVAGRIERSEGISFAGMTGQFDVAWALFFSISAGSSES